MLWNSGRSVEKTPVFCKSGTGAVGAVVDPTTLHNDETNVEVRLVRRRVAKLVQSKAINKRTVEHAFTHAITYLLTSVHHC